MPAPDPSNKHPRDFQVASAGIYRWQVWALVAAVVLVLIAFLWFGLGKGPEAEAPPPATATQATPAETAPPAD